MGPCVEMPVGLVFAIFAYLLAGTLLSFLIAIYIDEEAHPQAKFIFRMGGLCGIGLMLCFACGFINWIEVLSGKFISPTAGC